MTTEQEYRERFDEFSSEYLLDLEKSGQDGLDPNARSAIRAILTERGDTDNSVERTQSTSGWHRHGKATLLRLFIIFFLVPLLAAVVLVAIYLFWRAFG